MKILTFLKLAVAAGTVLFCPVTAMAQGSYAKLSAGYCIGTSYDSGINRTEKSLEQVKIAYGKGINGTLAGGYMFDSHFGIEVGAGYLLGGKSAEHIEKYNIGSGTPEKIEELDKEYYARMVMFKPAFVVSAGRQGISPYALAGPIAGVGKLHTHFTRTQPERIESNTEYKGGVALGGHGAFGFEVNDETKNTFFMEVTFNSLSYSPKKGEVTKFMVGDNDRLGGMTVRDRETEFTDKIELDSSSSKDKPYLMLKSNHPLSSIGLNAGIRFKL